jgi:hypothetical protein
LLRENIASVERDRDHLVFPQRHADVSSGKKGAIKWKCRHGSSFAMEGARAVFRWQFRAQAAFPSVDPKAI